MLTKKHFKTLATLLAEIKILTKGAPAGDPNNIVNETLEKRILEFCDLPGLKNSKFNKEIFLTAISVEQEILEKNLETFEQIEKEILKLKEEN